ncbi:SusD/RagB family nutrient-binding outer membrane lipoprotein [Chitinophaga alhagiae]|uniref:SusD/RagB family nutrient-binding outer membrane lipoprotein n=1 Tax=Chitinophaga alhagiae TaxID=2203219 RepID=A0ABN5LPC6_9BACT|nr:SusD/RagB family nutrient-binding outer membrane lipoprotein [Chitinophaga alhagiae]AWO00664.1 SusD/RagB family nutrient-binding outer membrane lipoprotein [Chitinophaga alhagiae]
MKNRKFLTYITGGLISTMVLMAGCTKDFEELNTPPTSVTDVDAGLLLSKVQKDAAMVEGNERANIEFGSWIQHWAGGQVAPVSRYIQQPTDGVWASHYALLRNLMQIRTQSLKGMESNPAGKSKLAIAKIMEVTVWQRLTDLFGDVPSSETSENASNVNTKPVYDTQESIYTRLIADLDNAMAQLDPADASYGNADFYFKGDAAKWKRFANSLKLRLGMRIRYAAPQLAEKTVREAMAQPLLAGNTENAAIPTYNNAQTTNAHPVLQQFIGGSPDLRYLADALVRTLKTKNDPRLPMIAAPTVNSVKAGTPDYRGMGVALTDAELLAIIKDDYSTASTTTYFNRTLSTPIPCYVFTYADVCFFKAEAALLGWGATAADAETFFKDGVKAAMALQPYNITTIPPAYETAELSFAGLSAEQQLEKIMTQKWILLFGRDYEAFTEWRRTGYPVLTPGGNQGSTNGTIPRRAVYSSLEVLLNGENYRAAVSRLTQGDAYVSRVWWDKKP